MSSLIFIHARLLFCTMVATFFLALLSQYSLPHRATVSMEAAAGVEGAAGQQDPGFTHIILPAQVRGALTDAAVLDPVVARLGAARIGHALDPYRFGETAAVAAEDAIRRRLGVVAGSRPGTVELRLETSDPAFGRTILETLAPGSRAAPPTEGMSLVRIAPTGRIDVITPDRSIGSMVAIAALAALLAGLAALALREALEKGFASPGAVEALTGLPVLSAIPELPGDAAPADAVVAAPDTPFARALRRLAHEVDLGEVTAVALCSALPAEGKTTLSIALARTLAGLGRRVVLVDCDGRRRALSRSFPGEPALGLTDLMAARATIDQVAERDPLSAATLIRHGPEGTIQDLSNRTAVRALVRDLRQKFDVVLLDTGPVLALAEARVIASVVDEVLLVARWRSTPVAATRLALKLLYAANARLAGAALTRIRRAAWADEPMSLEDAQAWVTPPDLTQEGLHPARAAMKRGEAKGGERRS